MGRKHLIIGLVIVCMVAALAVDFALQIRDRAAVEAASRAVVVATVNGTAIYANELNAAMPTDAFDMTLAQARQAKLERLAGGLVLRQFLDAENIEVPQEQIDSQVSDLRKNPPPVGCPCCRYTSLEQYLSANYMDMNELRVRIANDIGFKKYLSEQWEKDFPAGPGRDSLIEKEKPRIVKEYVRCSHIMFKTTLGTAAVSPADRKKAQANAVAAWGRLQKGEPFETVAREVSEDTMSGAAGGDLGCIDANIFGDAFAAAVRALEPGRYGAPIESAWGFHIIRRETVRDDDIASVLSEEYFARKAKETFEHIRNTAEVKYMKRNPAPARQGA